MTAVRLSPRAAVAKGIVVGYLRPRMAMDAAVPDLNPVARILGKRGFDKAQVATLIRQASAGLLAADADLEDIGEVIEALAPILDREEEGEDTEANSAFPMAGETEDEGWDRRARDARARLGRDESEEEREEREHRQSAEDARRRLGHDETPEECERREAAMDARHARDRKARRAADAKRRLGRDETPEEMREREAREEGEDRRRADDRKRARDAARGRDRRADDARRADDRRRASDARRRADDKWVRRADDAKRTLGRDESEEERWKREEEQEAEDARQADDARRRADDARHRTAMDEAIKNARRVEREISAARDEVRPWVGSLPVTLAADSANEIYKKALDMLGVDTAGVDPSAFKTILNLVPVPGSGSRRMAQDASPPAGVKSVAERYPDMARVRVMG